MTFNATTFDCECDNCGHLWRSRAEIPKKCPACSAYTWNDGTRKFSSILARCNGDNPEQTMREFCILEELERPDIMTDDVFYFKKSDIDLYMKNAKMPGGSALIFLGNFVLPKDRILNIKDMKVIICFERAFRTYNALNIVYRKLQRTAW